MISKTHVPLLVSLLIISSSMASYIDYDGVNIYFSNNGQMGVFTCKPDRCYPGFANIYANETIRPTATPLNDYIINISINYSNVSKDYCALRFVFSSDVELFAENGPIYAYGDGKTHIAVSQILDSDDFEQIPQNNHLCIKAKKGSGIINLYVYSDLFAEKFIEDNKVPKKSKSKNITRSSNDPLVSIQKNDGEQLIGMKYLLASLAVILIILLLVFFNKRKPGYRLNKKHYPKLADDSETISRMASNSKDTRYPDMDKLLKD